MRGRNSFFKGGVAMFDLAEIMKSQLSLFSKGKIVNSKSFKIGTVRLLDDNKEFKNIWKNMELWVKENTKNLKRISVIGSGGNINKIFKISGRAMGKPLYLSYIKNQLELLSNLSYEERIMQLDLNPDRADVIIPATKIYLSIMEWSGANKIFVPKIGLADGIVKNLYSEK